MRRACTITMAGVAMVALSVLASPDALGQTAPPSRTTSSFSWTFDGKCCIASRTWTTTLAKDIWIDVDTFSPCSVGSLGQVKVRVKLYREDWSGWTQVGTYRDFLACGGGDYVWRTVSPDNYKFTFDVLAPWRDKATYHAAGTLAYDGSIT